MKIRPLTRIELEVKGPACANSKKGKDWIEDTNDAVAQFFENLLKKN